MHIWYVTLGFSIHADGFCFSSKQASRCRWRLVHLPPPYGWRWSLQWSCWHEVKQARSDVHGEDEKIAKDCVPEDMGSWERGPSTSHSFSESRLGVDVGILVVSHGDIVQRGWAKCDLGCHDCGGGAWIYSRWEFVMRWLKVNMCIMVHVNYENHFFCPDNVTTGSNGLIFFFLIIRCNTMQGTEQRIWDTLCGLIGFFHWIYGGAVGAYMSCSLHWNFCLYYRYLLPSF